MVNLSVSNSVLWVSIGVCWTKALLHPVFMLHSTIHTGMRVTSIFSYQPHKLPEAHPNALNSSDQWQESRWSCTEASLFIGEACSTVLVLALSHSRKDNIVLIKSRTRLQSIDKLHWLWIKPYTFTFILLQIGIHYNLVNRCAGLLRWPVMGVSFDPH